MDDPQLLPTALFSPSKAAAQKAAAQDWQRVDVWLSSKFQGRTVPQFERNEDTLRALQELVGANEKADEERDILWSLQKDASAELKASKDSEDLSDTTKSVLHGLATSLDAPGKAALESLAGLSVTLEGSNPYTESQVDAIITTTQTSHSLTQQLMHLQNVQRELEAELLAVRQQLQEVRSSAFQPPLSLQKQTLDWTRNTKQLRTKLSEYSDRLAGLQGSGSSDEVDVVQVADHERIVQELQVEVENLEREVEAYEGLPRNKDAARRLVERATKELEMLKQKRDGLFEALVEQGRPD